MNKLVILLPLFATLPAHADVTWVQETSPGTCIVTNRGYVTTDAGGGFTRVQPTRNGIVDTSRPGYLIGPDLSDPLSDPKSRARSYDRYESDR